ncbi:MAG: hypothetical protein MSG64_14455 [Pyrinomonadaceae bacterium MAG19_C2-C3]|nr:hypothetical protein [Pyrinomonadaceae bacterium MAG19_C2-C3]
MSNIEIPESVRQWKIGSGSANIRSWNNYQNNQGYNLFCQNNAKYLTWKEVPLGINLAFTGDASLKKTHFRLPDGGERDILSGESIAFGIGGGKAFLRYAHRDVGINLEWSANPVFEWRIFGSNNQTGTPIAENSSVAIVNDKVKPSPDFFIFLERPPGMADVGWTTSPGFMNSILNAVDRHKVEIAKAVLGVPPVPPS